MGKRKRTGLRSLGRPAWAAEEAYRGPRYELEDFAAPTPGVGG